MPSQSNDACPICQTPLEAGVPACPACGFKLMDATLKFTPVMMGDEEDVAPLRKAAKVPVLRMVRGPQVGITYPLDSEEVTIGRDPKSTIFLNDMTVSRDHAKIVSANDSFVIFDCESYNGVWVNNDNVEAYTLKDGDFVQIGKFGFVFDMA